MCVLREKCIKLALYATISSAGEQLLIGDSYSEPLAIDSRYCVHESVIQQRNSTRTIATNLLSKGQTAIKIDTWPEAKKIKLARKALNLRSTTTFLAILYKLTSPF